MNESRTCANLRTKLTQPVLLELIDRHGNAWPDAQFHTASAAASCAAMLWPDQEEAETRGDGKGWFIEVVGSTPDDVQVVGAGNG